MEIIIQKGSRIRAQWFKANSLASLAGTQLKMAATMHEIVGTIRHIRSNDPAFPPDKTMLFVELDEDDGTGTLCEKCGVKEIEIRPTWIVEGISL